MESDTNVKLMTMRDLIVAISDAACEVLEDEDKAQQIAGVVLMRLLAASAPETAQYLFSARSTSIR
ncbi:MAG TPA: hypothetical protein VFD87_04230 [Phototrophicaceae bacterium]|nr:hypothetical protein [Phototrophicaceae bacterium]